MPSYYQKILSCVVLLQNKKEADSSRKSLCFWAKRLKRSEPAIPCSLQAEVFGADELAKNLDVVP